MATNIASITSRLKFSFLFITSILFLLYSPHIVAQKNFCDKTLGKCHNVGEVKERYNTYANTPNHRL